MPETLVLSFEEFALTPEDNIQMDASKTTPFGLDIMSDVTPTSELTGVRSTYSSGGWSRVPGSETMPLDDPNDPDV